MESSKASPQETTIQEIEEKLRQLEMAIFPGQSQSSISHASHSPFQTLPSVRKRLEELKAGSSQTLGTHNQSKLPPVPLPSFDGQDFESFCKEFLRFLRLTGLVGADDETKRDWLTQACHPKIRKMVDSLADRTQTFDDLLDSISQLFPKVENSISIRQQLGKVPGLQRDASPAEVETLLLELDNLFSKLPSDSFSEEERLLLLVSKLNPETWREIRAERTWRNRCDSYESLKELLREKSKDDNLERYLFSQVHKRERGFFMGEETPIYNQFALGKGKGGRGKGNPTPAPPQNPNSNFQNHASQPLSQIMSQAMGKGKGKGKRKCQQDVKPPQFKAKIVCKFCKKTGHYESDCWTKEKVERQKKNEDKKKSGMTNSQNQKQDLEDPNKKRKFGEINLSRKITWYLDSMVFGKRLDSIVDSGATVSAVASRHTMGAKINKADACYIKVGNGEVIHSEGTTDVEVKIGDLRLLHTCQVLDTNAFDCILGPTL